MAKPQPVTEQEISLRKRARRRLVGAIALVLLVAVVLPWVVDDDPPPRLKNVDIAIPAVESVDRKFPPAAPVAGQNPAPVAGQSPAPVAEPIPAGGSQAGTATPQASTDVPTAESVPKPSDAPPGESKQSGRAPTAPEPSAEASPSKPAARSDPKPDGKPAVHAPTGKGFVMQVGAFSSLDKAKQLQQQLRAAGFPAYLESVKTASGERTRVRAGPFATVEAAQKARTRLLGLKVAQGDLKVVPREN